jgi:Flp pilus assembly protein TadG
MNLYNFLPRLRARLSNENAQVLPMMAVLMIGFLGMAALVADVGDVYYSYNELVASTNAAALAAAVGLATSNAIATTDAENYGSYKGEINQFGNLNVPAVLKVNSGCDSDYTLLVPCKFGDDNSSNAVQVTQTAQVKTYFAALFGTPYVNLTATASALMGSPSAVPRNIAVILDTTESMTADDSSCSTKGKTTEEACAQAGVQAMLTSLQPCTPQGCGSATANGYQNVADSVALFTFPELSSSSQQQYDTDCSTKNPSITPYTFPSDTGNSYNPGTGGDYEVAPFSTNYQTVTSGSPTGTLNGGTGSGASALVNAAGGGGCADGMGDPGGEGTYYAGVLYAAQAALLAQQQALLNQTPSVQSTNVIIILSDGAATASKTQMQSTANSGGTYTSTSGSYVNECQQAITAANSIKAAGTTIYSIAYGAQTSGCTTDNSKGESSPCATMQLMAGNQQNQTGGSSSADFFSGNQNGSNNCQPSSTSPNYGVDSLSGIFSKIVDSFGPARLIPNAGFSPS